MGERLQKAKVRCQAAEATKPIDLEEVGAIGRLGMDGPLVGGNLGENSSKNMNTKMI